MIEEFISIQEIRVARKVDLFGQGNTVKYLVSVHDPHTFKTMTELAMT